MSSTMAAWLLVLGWLPMLVRLPRPETRLARAPGGSMTGQRPSPASTLDRALWGATWILGAALTACAVFDVRRTAPLLRLAGVALFFTGMALWSWARAVQGEQFAQMIRAPRALVTRGPYRVCRHPLYASTALGCAGQTLAAGSARTLLLWLGLVAVLALRSVREEQLLRHAFVPEWDDYARHAAGFLRPRVRSSSKQHGN